MEERAKTIQAFDDWYKSRRKVSGIAPKGTISGALSVLETLKTDFSLDIEDHTAVGGAQIVGVSGARVKKILEEHGEYRAFVSEGGRTNRGLRGDIREMLAALERAQLESLDRDVRNSILTELQGYLVEEVAGWHNRQRLRFKFDSAASTRKLIQDLLQTAREEEKGGQFAQYLVGAKLEQRLGQPVSNESYSTADVQLGRRGDFLIGDTVFHVTLAPGPGVFEKCRSNIRDGYRPFLLVPEGVLTGARQNAELTDAGRISVESIESFVAQNVDELSHFSATKLRPTLYKLLEIYNRRVDEVENDKSLMIDIPPNLTPG